MHKLIEEFTHPDGAARESKFRIGKTLASALAGFIAGVAGTAFYFWFILKNILPTYCQ